MSGCQALLLPTCSQGRRTLCAVSAYVTLKRCFGNAQIAEARACELAALAVRKYLDALCVFFWAATPLLQARKPPQPFLWF